MDDEEYLVQLVSAFFAGFDSARFGDSTLPSVARGAWSYARSRSTPPGLPLDEASFRSMLRELFEPGAIAAWCTIYAGEFERTRARYEGRSPPLVSTGARGSRSTIELVFSSFGEDHVAGFVGWAMHRDSSTSAALAQEEGSAREALVSEILDVVEGWASENDRRWERESGEGPIRDYLEEYAPLFREALSDLD